MNLPRVLLSGVAFAAFAAVAFPAGGPSGQQNASSENPAAQAAAAAGTEQSASPEKPAVSADAKYSKVAEKNIFYPRQESVVQTGEAGTEVNPGGSSLRLTGVVRSGRRVFVVIENTGTGESSIVTRGESTGAGEIVEATLDGITLTSESGSFRIPVGYYLSGAKGPEIQAVTKSPDQQAGAKAGETATNQPPGAPVGTEQAPAATAGNPPSGDANARSGGFAGGGRRRPTQEQMDAFRNMTPEQRQSMRDSFRQRRGRRPDNGDANQ